MAARIADGRQQFASPQKTEGAARNRPINPGFDPPPQAASGRWADSHQDREEGMTSAEPIRPSEQASRRDETRNQWRPFKNRD